MIGVHLIGQMDNTKDHTFESANRVYGIDGICPALDTCGGGNLHKKVLVPITTDGKQTDVAKTILAGYERTNMTGFNSDNAVLEKNSWWFEQNINTENGIVRTLKAGGGSGNIPKVVEENADVVVSDVIRYDDYNQNIPDDQDVMGTITTHIGHGMRGGTKLIEQVERSETELAESNQIYRIRKLTPKECFRLMGVKDEDYDKVTASDTQKYKQAGNSIVVDVLQGIFENMFVNECKKNRLF